MLFAKMYTSMRYILYLFTLALVFVGGMLVGNVMLPESSSSLSATVSVPPLNTKNPALEKSSAQQAQQDLILLNDALSSCSVISSTEKDRLLNDLRLRIALDNFELKKLRLELEMAKNNASNRTTSQFAQAGTEYNQARQQVEKMLEELFPLPAEEETQAPAEEPAEPAEAAPTEEPAQTNN